MRSWKISRSCVERIWGLDRDLFSVKYENRTSLFTRWWVYREDSIGNGADGSQYYQCLTEETARRVAADLVEQAETGITWERLVFRAGLDMASVDRAGVDECWYGYAEEEGSASCVLVLPDREKGGAGVRADRSADRKNAGRSCGGTWTFDCWEEFFDGKSAVC